MYSWASGFGLVGGGPRPFIIAGEKPTRPTVLKMTISPAICPLDLIVRADVNALYPCKQIARKDDGLEGRALGRSEVLSAIPERVRRHSLSGSDDHLLGDLLPDVKNALVTLYF